LHMVMRDEAAGKTRLVRLLVITQEGSIPVAAGHPQQQCSSSRDRLRRPQHRQGGREATGARDVGAISHRAHGFRGCVTRVVAGRACIWPYTDTGRIASAAARRRQQQRTAVGSVDTTSRQEGQRGQASAMPRPRRAARRHAMARPERRLRMHDVHGWS
jgi:hypothetical protein